MTTSPSRPTPAERRSIAVNRREKLARQDFNEQIAEFCGHYKLQRNMLEVVASALKPSREPQVAVLVDMIGKILKETDPMPFNQPAFPTDAESRRQLKEAIRRRVGKR